MHLEHEQLLKALKKHAQSKKNHWNNDSYLSSGHVYYGVSVPNRRSIAKQWLKENRDMSTKEFLTVLDSLYEHGDSHEEKTIASILLGYHKDARTHVSTARVGRWLNHLVGWAEVDHLCQNIFSAEDLLSRWDQWDAFIQKLQKSANIHKRRASIVLLTNAVRHSADRRLGECAFATIDVLKHERDILITKAVSWLLRDLTTHYRDEVQAYLIENNDILPKVAIRETKRKLMTGKK